MLTTTSNEFSSPNDHVQQRRLHVVGDVVVVGGGRSERSNDCQLGLTQIWLNRRPECGASVTPGDRFLYETINQTPGFCDASMSLWMSMWSGGSFLLILRELHIARGKKLHFSKS